MILLLLLIIFLSAIVSICIAVAILTREKKKIRNILIIIGVFFLILVAALVGGLTLVMMKKGMDNGKEVTKSGAEITTGILSPRFIMSKPHLQKLVSMQPKDIGIPDEYYTYAGIRDYYRMPLIYPYSLTTIDDLEFASIENEKGVRILVDSKHTKNVAGSIIKLVFDKNVLLAEQGDRWSDGIVSGYLILHFESENIQFFKDMESMKDAATDLGFDIEENPLITVKEYHELF